jgi:ferredoxin-NADP reductase
MDSLVNVTSIKSYRIVEIENLSSDTKAFRLAPLNGDISQFTPGQFVFLHILDGSGNSTVKKPFSITSSPGADHLEFCIKMIHGSLTGKLETIGVGGLLGLENPGGHLTYNGQKKAGFIAGGTGIAPIMSMLRHIAERKLEGEFVFFYSLKTSADILYLKELEALKKMNPNIRVVVTLTQDNNGWEGEKGRVDRDMIARHLQNAREFSWWICGPLEMIKSMRQNLESLGADPKMMKMEGWG